MGCEPSKPKRDPTDGVFELLASGAPAYRIRGAIDELKLSDPNIALEKLIHKPTGYNALMAVLSTLPPPPNSPIDYEEQQLSSTMEDRLLFVEVNAKYYDVSYVSPVDGKTVLHLLADLPGCKQSQRVADLVERVLAEGANPSVFDKTDQTPLMIAALKGRELIVNELCGAGATVNFLTPSGYSPLLSAIAGGNLPCVSRILSLCNAEVKTCKFYDNGATGDDKQDQEITDKRTTQAAPARVRARRPFEVAIDNLLAKTQWHPNFDGDLALFEFLLKNNFDLSEWNSLYNRMINAPSGNPLTKKYFNRGAWSGMYGIAATEREMGNGFGLGHVEKLTGNALAQACLISHIGVFRFLLDEFNPNAPSSAIPHNASVLHVIASFKPTPAAADMAIDFVDAVREKCVMYAPDGTYDWMVRDDNGKTPLDYCIAANEKSIADDKMFATQPTRLESAAAALHDDSKRAREILSISKAFTALIFIETLKNGAALREVDAEMHLVIREGDADVLQVLSVCPEVLAAKVTRITIGHCDFTRVQLEHLRHFENLECLVFYTYGSQKNPLNLTDFLGPDFGQDWNEERATTEEVTFLKKLKYLGIVSQFVTNRNELQSKKIKREGLEIEIVRDETTAVKH